MSGTHAPPMWRRFSLELTSLAAFVVLLAVPAILGQERRSLLIADFAVIYAIVAVGLNIVMGYSGQISIAQAALVAVGGYSSGVLVIRVGWSWIAAAPAGIFIATVAGALLGLLTNRVRTHYLILITLAFHTGVLLVIVNEADITGGPVGLYPIPPLQFGPYIATGPQQLFYAALTAAVALVYAAERLRRSRVGLAMFAIQANERGAQAAAIDPAYYRTLAMALSGLYAGVGGILFAAQVQFLGPESFDLGQALFYIVIVVLGGMGNTLGVIIVAVLLSVAQQELRVLADYSVLIYGVLVMVVMAIAPGGIPEAFALAFRARSRVRWRHRAVIPE